MSMYELVDDALRTVYDPEIPVNIVDLGLVYEVNIEDEGKVEIVMTLTAPGCPVAGDIVADVENKLRAVDGVNEVKVDLVFNPPWTQDMMTDEAKLELGFL